MDIPFDNRALDELLIRNSLDAVIATSPHNVRYLSGVDPFFLYSVADSIGLSRYVPALAYRREAPELAAYVGAGNEAWAVDVQPLWVTDVRLNSWSADATAAELAAWCQATLVGGARVGFEAPYLPAAAYRILAESDISLVDATELLEELRAVKRAGELDLIREASGSVADAMLETFSLSGPGDTKADVVERLRRAETNRGLCFCYALVAAGHDVNRAPCGQRLQEGEVLSLDSGATMGGWVADLTRMGIIGEPTERHEDLLRQVDYVQQAATALAVAGTIGGELFEAGRAAIEECDDSEAMSFLAHGTGLVTHEAPRLTADGSPPYPAAHAGIALRAGMVLSIESQVTDPEIGFIKLEDTVIVGEHQPELVAPQGRGWNRIGV